MQPASDRAVLSRRRALALGFAGAGGLALLGAAQSSASTFPQSLARSIEHILEIDGTISNGVLSLSPARKDITGVTLHGTPIKPGFMLHGDFVFQSMGGSEVMMNGDTCLKTDEVNRFVGALIKNGITVQAEHQHMYDFTPIVWFMHFRARGNGENVARALKAALSVTAMPFPQHKPANPTTPLPAAKLGSILGATPQIGAGGIVTFGVPRANPMVLGGVHVNPHLNVESPVEFQPMGSGRAAAFADYGMVASEVQHVMGHMHGLGWDSGCLYNQETDEQPQLYFSHQFKTGDAVALAHEIRSGFNLMNMKFT